VLGDEVPAGTEFEICLIGPSPETTSHCATVAGAGTVAFDGLVPGTYQLVETDPGEGYSVSLSDDTVVVVARYMVSASITNTYTAPTTTTQPPASPTPPPTSTTQPPTTQPPSTQPPTTQGPESQTPTTPPPPTTTVAQLAGGGTRLPATGSDGRTAAVAAGVLVLGATLILLGRRRPGRGTA